MNQGQIGDRCATGNRRLAAGGLGLTTKSQNHKEFLVLL